MTPKIGGSKIRSIMGSCIPLLDGRRRTRRSAKRGYDTGLQPKELFKIFYNTYIKIILVVLEDALIRIYIVEDTKSLCEEIDSMLSNLIELNPIGGLASNIQILSDISSGRPKSSEDDPNVEFIDTYAHTSFVWSQSAQLISDYINSIESSESISLEKANQSLKQRMERVAKRYKTF